MLAIAASYTCEPLKACLDFWLERLGWSDEVKLAGYNQILQSLADPRSLFLDGTSKANVILVRDEDWLRFADRPRSAILDKGSRDFLTKMNRELIEAIQRASAATPTPFIVLLCQPSAAIGNDPASARFIAGLHEELALAVRPRSNVHVVTGHGVAERYRCHDALDAHTDELGHVPYTPEFFAAMGTALARMLFALRSPPKKVIVLDCDQTLWRGILGEDGVAGVVVDPARRALQAKVKALRSEGFLLCLCSKNNEPDVWELFDAAKPDMVLGRNEIDAWRINWREKAENIKELAAELNVGLDSFIFIDDSSMECARVRMACPEVTTIQLPEDETEIRELLDHVWAFDRLSITAEDRDRGRMYREERAREQVRQSASTLGDFLASLDLVVEVAPPAAHELARVSQLTQRTNQFNLTTIRRSEAELTQLLGETKHECLAIRVKDRFGDYGLVGAVIYGTEGGYLDVDTFLLSCRVLGRGVEHQILARLGRTAIERHAESVRLTLVPTAKNHPAKEFLESVLVEFREQRDGAIVYRVPASRAAELVVRVDQTPAPAIAESRKPQPAGGVARPPSEIASELIELRTARHVLLRLAKPVEAAADDGSVEGTVGRILSELLEVASIDSETDFYSVGGDSLKALNAMAMIRRELEVELPIDALFAGECSVAKLARRIHALRAGQPGEIAK